MSQIYATTTWTRERIGADVAQWDRWDDRAEYDGDGNLTTASELDLDRLTGLTSDALAAAFAQAVSERLPAGLEFDVAYGTVTGEAGSVDLDGFEDLAESIYNGLDHDAIAFAAATA